MKFVAVALVALSVAPSAVADHRHHHQPKFRGSALVREETRLMDDELLECCNACAEDEFSDVSASKDYKSGDVEDDLDDCTGSCVSEAVTRGLPRGAAEAAAVCVDDCNKDAAKKFDKELEKEISKEVDDCEKDCEKDCDDEDDGCKKDCEKSCSSGDVTKDVKTKDAEKKGVKEAEECYAKCPDTVRKELQAAMKAAKAAAIKAA